MGHSVIAPANGRAANESQRLVLDTNVWLDWLVFDDAGVAPVKSAVECGLVRICIDSVCEDELARALAYRLGKRQLDSVEQEACLEECRRITGKVSWPGGKVISGEEGAPEPILDSRLRGSDEIVKVPSDGVRLPVCRDPDDQKFLELARDCAADFLITRDRALLILAQRKVGPPFRIMTPQEFGAWLSSEARESARSGGENQDSPSS